MQKALLCSALGAALLAPATQAQVVINEFSPNPPGGDPATQTVELRGTPGESFSGLILSIDSDATGDGFFGTVDRLTQVTGTFDANGLVTFDVPDFENPSNTVVLTAGDGTVALDDDLDADGDGMLDSLDSLGTVFDAINVPDSEDDALVGYATQLGGTSLAFVGSEPEHLFRETTTGNVFVYTDFDDTVYDAAGVVTPNALFDLPVGVTTFGAVNPSFVDAPDSDGDGITDNVDNCTEFVNPMQVDSNGDGIGNVCDADIASAAGAGADDCTVNFFDLGRMKDVFFTSDPDADLVGLPGQGPDGTVSFFDLGRMKELFFTTPGPSATGCDNDS